MANTPMAAKDDVRSENAADAAAYDPAIHNAATDLQSKPIRAMAGGALAGAVLGWLFSPFVTAYAGYNIAPKGYRALGAATGFGAGFLAPEMGAAYGAALGASTAVIKDWADAREATRNPELARALLGGERVTVEVKMDGRRVAFPTINVHPSAPERMAPL